MKKGIRAVKRVLAESAFDPEEPGPISTIVNCAPNRDYLVHRAIEILTGIAPEGPRNEVLRDVISLLAFARL